MRTPPHSVGAHLRSDIQPLASVDSQKNGETRQSGTTCNIVCLFGYISAKFTINLRIYIVYLTNLLQQYFQMNFKSMLINSVPPRFVIHPMLLAPNAKTVWRLFIHELERLSRSQREGVWNRLWSSTPLIRRCAKLNNDTIIITDYFVNNHN